MYWPKLSNQKIKLKIFEALSKNANYRSENILGIPGTFLDTEVFYDGEPFLKDAPFLSTLIANPNHIGCHTLEDEHEEMFNGTQEIEKDLIRICAEEIFKAEPHSYDGYIASGGTEANIEALWIYRNYFQQEMDAKLNEIAVIYSEDTHYSIPKAINLLGLKEVIYKVRPDTREIDVADIESKLNAAIIRGKKYFIVVLNLSTTMFGSVDDIDRVYDLLSFHQLDFKIHIDAAFGGFIYPFTNADSKFTFADRKINSISLDGHKMMQAPYGTGIFLIRKNFMKYVCTQQAAYVQGMDYTVCGSRSGANAICLWMIFHAHGSVGWALKMNNLLEKTTGICKALDELGVEYYRNPYVNIISIKSKYVSAELAKQFYLVPDTHTSEAAWYKIVVMPHVKPEITNDFLEQLAYSLKQNEFNK